MSTNKILSNDQIKEMILAARGDLAPDLVLKNARIVNVFTKEIESGDVAIKDGYIVGIGEFDGEEEIDIGGRIICPGLIDGHIHIESSMISPSEFAGAVATCSKQVRVFPWISSSCFRPAFLPRL